MNKIKALILAAFVMLSGFVVNAQNELTAEQMIPVRVLMLQNDNIDADALAVLYNRLNQAVTLNGLGSVSDENRFLIVPSVTVLSNIATASVPVQYMAEVEVSVYFVDNVNKTILAQETITKNGMDSSDDLAVAKAIKLIQARDPKLKKLIKLGKERAAEFDASTETTDKDSGAPDVSWIFNEEK